LLNKKQSLLSVKGKNAFDYNFVFDVEMALIGGFNMWKLVGMLFLLFIGGIGGIAIVSVFEGNEVFTGFVAGLAAMLGMIIVLLLFIAVKLSALEKAFLYPKDKLYTNKERRTFLDKFLENDLDN
jgi:hypothetical protein